MPGAWILRAEDIKELTPQQIQGRFQLKLLPTKYHGSKFRQEHSFGWVQSIPINTAVAAMSFSLRSRVILSLVGSARRRI